jgi:hypothetical protein
MNSLLSNPGRKPPSQSPHRVMERPLGSLGPVQKVREVSPSTGKLTNTLSPGKPINSYLDAVSAATKHEIELARQLPRTFDILERANNLANNNPDFVCLNAPELVLFIAEYFRNFLRNKWSFEEIEAIGEGMRFGYTVSDVVFEVSKMLKDKFIKEVSWYTLDS